MLHILQRPFLADRILVPEDDNLRVLPKESINVLQRLACRLGIQKVHDRDESSVEDSPDDVEPPMQGLNADRCNFDHHGFESPIRECELISVG